MASAINTFQAQLEERLLTASDAIVSQMQDQARAITEKAHATTLAPHLLLIENLLQEVRSSLNNSRAAPPGADGSRRPPGSDESPGPAGPRGLPGLPGPPGASNSSSNTHMDLLLLNDLK